MIIVGTGIGCVATGIIMLYQQIEMSVGNIAIPAGLILLVWGLAFVILGRLNRTNRRKSSKKFTCTLLDIVLPTAIIFFVVSAGFYFLPRSRAIADIVNAQSILRDILQIVLAIAGVTIAVFGYLVYRIVVHRLEVHAKGEIQSDTWRTTARLLTETGFVYWMNFQTTKDKRYLEQAIGVTESAHEYTRILDECKSENELVIGAIRNNLAWYFASRHRPEDKNQARGYAEYIHARSHNFPEVREDWEDTYNEVMRVYP